MTTTPAAAAALPNLTDRVTRYYTDLLDTHGPTAEGMGYKNADAQELRYRIISEVTDLNGLAVHEVGCGVGHLAGLLTRWAPRARFSGSDILPASIDIARRTHPACRFAVRDVLGPSDGWRYDVVVTSGMLNLRLEYDDAAWEQWVCQVLRNMYAMCTVALAFNGMSDQVDFRDPNLFYANPMDIAEFCRAELSPQVVVRHDYPLYEYTVYVYRDSLV